MVSRHKSTVRKTSLSTFYDVIGRTLEMDGVIKIKNSKGESMPFIHSFFLLSVYASFLSQAAIRCTRWTVGAGHVTF